MSEQQDKPVSGLIDGQWQPGMWGEFPRLLCIHCQWDTLEGIEAAREYTQNCPRCHPEPEPVKPALVYRSDRYGNPIEVPFEEQ